MLIEIKKFSLTGRFPVFKGLKCLIYKSFHEPRGQKADLLKLNSFLICVVKP